MGRSRGARWGTLGICWRLKRAGGAPQWGILTAAKEMPAHYTEGWTLWFLSGAVPTYQSCPVLQSCSGFPLLALHFCWAPCDVLSRSTALVLSPGFTKLDRAMDAAASKLGGTEGSPQLLGLATKPVGFSNKWSGIAPEIEKICRKNKV